MAMIENSYRDNSGKIKIHFGIWWSTIAVLKIDVAQPMICRHLMDR